MEHPCPLCHSTLSILHAFCHQSPSGFDKTGPYRAAFIITALRDLRQALRDRGSDLIVRIGRPEEVLAEVGTLGAVLCS